MRFFWTIFLKVIGWKTNMEFPYPALKKYIVIVGPHTSNWDFVIGLAYRSILKMTSARFLGKKELFRPPFGFVFRALGGYPVDRKNSSNLVDDVAALFTNHESFALALSPEGTRKKVEKLRTGFYFIAKKANVPVIMAALDYKNKRAEFSEALYATDNQDEDFRKILTFYRRVEGRHPENGLMHL